MAKFYVGQMVRVIGCSHRNKGMIGHHVGKVVRIRKYYDEFGAQAWFVEPELRSINGVVVVWCEEHLSPLTDPGREVLSWADERCVWRPRGVTC